MELILQKVCGRSAQLPIRLRRCGPADAAAFFALQNEVRAAMPHPEQFVPDTLENITAYLREGLCIGAYDGERLGAYFILRYCGRSAHNYAAFMDVPRTEWEHWANADSAIVHADFRGNGLQRLMLEAALPLFPKKITHIGATVSPQNQYSLHNALASGFAIVSRREMYGGHDRYLLAKDLKKNRAAFPNGCSPVLQSIESLSLFFILCRTTSRQARCTAAVSTQLMG